jgi:hypothetical protein
MNATLKTSVLCTIACLAGAAVGVRAAEMKGDKTCGQMTAEMAVLPGSMASFLDALADDFDAHAAIMRSSGHAEAKAEIDGLQALVAELRAASDAVEKVKTSMESARSWPGAPHDMEKIKTDPNGKRTHQALKEKAKDVEKALKLATH